MRDLCRASSAGSDGADADSLCVEDRQAPRQNAEAAAIGEGQTKRLPSLLTQVRVVRSGVAVASRGEGLTVERTGEE